MNERELQDFSRIVKNLTDRIRLLETIQEGNGFVYYFYPPGYGTNPLEGHILHTVRPIAVNEYALCEIVMPRKAVNLEEVTLLYIPTGTGTWDYTVAAVGGLCGEDESTHGTNVAGVAEPCTDDIIQCMDITAMFAPFQVGDQIGVFIKCDALNTTTLINILGVRLR